MTHQIQFGPVILDGIAFHTAYVTALDMEAFLYAQRLREAKIDTWTGGIDGKHLVVMVPYDQLEAARAMQTSMKLPWNG